MSINGYKHLGRELKTLPPEIRRVVQMQTEWVIAMLDSIKGLSSESEVQHNDDDHKQMNKEITYLKESNESLSREISYLREMIASSVSATNDGIPNAGTLDHRFETVTKLIHSKHNMTVDELNAVHDRIEAVRQELDLENSETRQTIFEVIKAKESGLVAKVERLESAIQSQGPVDLENLINKMDFSAKVTSIESEQYQMNVALDNLGTEFERHEEFIKELSESIDDKLNEFGNMIPDDLSDKFEEVLSTLQEVRNRQASLTSVINKIGVLINNTV